MIQSQRKDKIKKCGLKLFAYSSDCHEKPFLVIFPKIKQVFLLRSGKHLTFQKFWAPKTLIVAEQFINYNSALYFQLQLLRALDQDA